MFFVSPEPNQPALARTDKSTATFIIEGDNNGVVGHNVTKTIVNQSSKRRNEGRFFLIKT